MPDDFVTRAELEAAIAKLEQKMGDGFADLKAQIADLAHKIENNQHKDKEQYDDRYLMREETLSEAIARLSLPVFRQACYPIVAEWLDTEDGKIKMGCIIDRHLNNKRDNATKWINFIKLVGGILLGAMMLWGGQTIVQTNIKTQQTVIEALRGLGE